MPGMPEISAARYRAGQGEPLVLVHGFTATWRCWMPVLAELVPRFDVLAPTLHGHAGGPPPPTGPAHSTEEAADHLEKLLDDQGVGEAHFAGNSMGGALSLEMAKRGRAKSVVAISPGGGWRADDTAEGERIIKWFERQRKMGERGAKYTPRLMRRPGLRKILLRDVMVHGELVSPSEAVDLAEGSRGCTVVDDVFATIRSGTALLRDLDRISCPTLVVWGAKDRILPMDRHAARFREEIPGVQFRVLPGLGHTPMWDDAGQIAGIIADWASTSVPQAPVQRVEEPAQAG
jgi:pimeloyl-ACP methyl ester carboxylesterase